MLRWTEDAWDDYLYWQTQGKRTLKRVNALMRDAMCSPFAGLGKPEPRTAQMGIARRVEPAHRFREPSGVYGRGQRPVHPVCP